MRNARNSLFAVGAIVMGAVCATLGVVGPAVAKPKATAPVAGLTAQAVVDGAWRTPEDRARDGVRHPVDSFAFWGIKPNMTVAEIRPGAGYWTDLLAPYLAAGGGKLIVTSGDPDKMSDAQKAGRDRYLKRYQENPALYGTLEVGVFAANSDKLLAAPNSVDLIISSRNFHGFVLQNIKDYALKSMYSALKPGGLVAIEQHRGDARRPQNPASGYMRQDWVIAQMRQAGFEFVRQERSQRQPKGHQGSPIRGLDLTPHFADRARRTACQSELRQCKIQGNWRE